MLSPNYDPLYDPSQTNQTVPVDITDEEVLDAYIQNSYKWYHRLFQIFCFLITLGPIRAAIGIASFFFVVVVVNTIRFIQFKITHDREYGKRPLIIFAHFCFRCICFASGIIWTNYKGFFDPEARFLISNHVAIIDPFVYMRFFKLTPVIKAEVMKVKMLNHIIECVDPVYVTREKSCHQTDILKARASDPNKFPVMIFPEGTISGGKFLLKFHRSAFLTKYKIQPTIIRYHMPLVPKGWNTYCWKSSSFLEHMWNLASMPLTFVTVEFLPVIQNDLLEPADIEKFSIQAQIIMGNALGLKAVKTSNLDLFRIRDKHYEEQKKFE